MSQHIQINAQLRSDVGKGASRRLRRHTDRVPGIIYGGTEDPINLSLAQNELVKAMENEAFYSQILDVVVEGKTSQAVVRDLQRHPASNKVQHVDFLRVSADKPIHVHVPLHFTNEATCVGVRLENGNIAHSMVEVEISSLPGALPQYIEVDMENMHVGESLHLSDLVLPEGVSIVALMYGDEDRDSNVVSVQAPRGSTDEQDEAAGEAGDATEGQVSSES